MMSQSIEDEFAIACSKTSNVLIALLKLHQLAIKGNRGR